MLILLLMSWSWSLQELVNYCGSPNTDNFNCESDLSLNTASKGAGLRSGLDNKLVTV